MAHNNKTPLTDDAKRRLRSAYGDPDIPLSDISTRFRMCADRITAVARTEGWPLRIRLGKTITFEEARP